MNARPPKLAWRIVAHVALVSLVAAVLYPMMLVFKKAFEPGPAFALSASPLPHAVTLDHFEDLFAARDGRLLFLRSTLNSLVIALATAVVGVAISCTAQHAPS